MVTKITVDFPRVRSYYPERKPLPGIYEGYDEDFETGYKQIAELEKIYHSISMFLLFMKQYPEHNIKLAIVGFFGEIKIDTTERTKKKRYYHIPYLYIHEEDK